MQIHAKLEVLIEEMLDGQILLDEAVAEFERLYIEKALARHKKHLSNTAKVLGIHRNTLSKRVTAYHKNARSQARSAKRSSR
ncbi:MAG: hypothetical protein H0W28_11030 [Pyrinomonadaceae bacterium]|nr:hypothetical protein [Pyrinomonadaceae bacterium]